jgi:outer membrane protein assembly factor BamB
MYQTGAAKNTGFPFTLPEKGGGMAHCDPKMSDFINMPIPEKDVNIVWHNCDIPGEFGGSKGLGFSSNGKIAAASYSGLSNNLIIYDYDGNRLWKSGDLLNALACASAPMVDIHGRVIACDNKVVLMVDTYDVDADGKILEWKSDLVDGGLPISPILTEDGTLIIATTNGPIYAFNIHDGSLLAMRYLNDNIDAEPSTGYYETINTPCVHGNRIYVSTQFSKDHNPANRRARLYALDINSASSNYHDRIKIAWYYEFDGPSGASPLLIDDTIYFDGNKSIQKQPFTMALIDHGDYPTLKWKTAIPNPIDSSLARDPRGGFWLVDALGGKLLHQSETDGSFIETINTDELIQEYGVHNPCSVITICGSKNRPLLVTAATALEPVKSSCYVIAVDLAHANTLLWKVKIYEGPLATVDFPFGQYPILMNHNKPRIIFTTVRHGAWAIGSDAPNDDADSPTTTPDNSQIRFPRLYTLLRTIYEKITAPLLKQAVSKLLFN